MADRPPGDGERVPVGKARARRVRGETLHWMPLISLHSDLGDCCALLKRLRWGPPPFPSRPRRPVPPLRWQGSPARGVGARV